MKTKLILSFLLIFLLTAGINILNATVTITSFNPTGGSGEKLFKYKLKSTNDNDALKDFHVAVGRVSSTGCYHGDTTKSNYKDFWAPPGWSAGVTTQTNTSGGVTVTTTYVTFTRTSSAAGTFQLGFTHVGKATSGEADLIATNSGNDTPAFDGSDEITSKKGNGPYSMTASFPSYPDCPFPNGLYPPMFPNAAFAGNIDQYYDTPAGIFSVQNIVIRNFDDALPLPPPGFVSTINFNSQALLQISFSGGPLVPLLTHCMMTVEIEYVGSDLNESFYSTEIVSMQLSGGGLPPDLIIRESPVLNSNGLIAIKETPPDYWIESFFDIFTELSFDYGNSWFPAENQGYISLGCINQPVIECLPDMIVATDPGTCTYTVEGDELDPVNINDHCGYLLSNNINGMNTLEGYVFPLGNNLITWTLGDICGQMTECSFNLAVIDTTPPEIICPDSMIIPAYDLGFQLDTSLANANDNCGSVQVIIDQPPVFPSGVTAVTWTAIDDAGNMASCIQYVTREKPLEVLVYGTEINCKGEATGSMTQNVTIFKGYGVQTVTLTPTLSDPSPVTYLWSTGETTETIIVSPTVNTTYSVTVTDISGQNTVASVTVNVTDISCGKGKINICHNNHTLCIKINAVSDHMRKHFDDCLGQCYINKDMAVQTADNIFIDHVVNVYPNPFNTKTTIYFSLPEAGHALINIFDMSGRHIVTLFDNDVFANFEYTVDFDGTSLPAGIYIYKINTNDDIYFGKILLIKE